MPWLPPDPKEEMRLEIFSSPYLFKKNSRLVIQSAQKEIRLSGADHNSDATGAANQLRSVRSALG